MQKSLRKRIISGLLAGVMAFSNVTITTSASDTSFYAADTQENEIISEEGDSYKVSGQSTNETEAQTIQIDGIDVIDDGETTEDIDVLGDEVTAEEKQTLYEDTMKFFEKLYGETTDSYDHTDDSVTVDEGAADEVGDESYDETEIGEYDGE